MLDLAAGPLIEGSFANRSPAEPAAPIVVSVPHAGIGTAGFEAALTPELDVRCDADMFVDRLYRAGDKFTVRSQAPVAEVVASL